MQKLVSTLSSLVHFYSGTQNAGPDPFNMPVDRKAQWQKADGEREEEEDPERET